MNTLEKLDVWPSYVLKAKGWGKYWDVYAVPGPDYQGVTLRAFFAQRESRWGWWQFKMHYGEIDECDPLSKEFNALLKNVRADQCSKQMRLPVGGWRWCWGYGLPKVAVEEIREGIASTYAKARELWLARALQ
jgi:hypothetical protein